MPRLSVAILLVLLGAAIGAGGTATLRAAGPFEGPWQLQTNGSGSAWRIDTKTGHMEICNFAARPSCTAMPGPGTSN